MRKLISRWSLVVLPVVVLSGSAVARAQLIESLYVSTSSSSTGITSEANSHGAPDGAQASITGNLANNQESWTLSFDNTVNGGLPVNSAELYLTHRQSGWIDDSLVLEYFDGTTFVEFDNFSSVPATLTTSGPYVLSGITSAADIDGFQVRIPPSPEARPRQVSHFSSVISPF